MPRYGPSKKRGAGVTINRKRKYGPITTVKNSQREKKNCTGREQYSDRDGLLWFDAFGDRRSFPAKHCKLEFLVRVRCVIEPLPGYHNERDGHVLHK